MNARELGTILAALRNWQNAIEDGPIDMELNEIATDDGKHEPLTASEIDALCEKLNTEPEPYAAVNCFGGVVQGGWSTYGTVPDVLDWDNFDDCRCDPRTNVYDPACTYHDADGVGYDHAVFLFLERKAGPPNDTAPATALEPDDD